MNTTTEEIIKFLAERSGISDIQPGSDIFEDMGMTGDDFHEMIEEYSKKFSVKMDTYLWYFHADDEGIGFSIGSILFKPPYKRVKRIPITPDVLTEFANKGAWDINYPNHSIPSARYDLLLNTLLFGLWIVIIIALIILR
jgi:hypothetical protein